VDAPGCWDDFRNRGRRDLDALNELTRLMAPPAWTNLIEMNRENVNITGEADQAAALLSLIDGSPCFQNSEFTMIAKNGSNEVFGFIPFGRDASDDHSSRPPRAAAALAGRCAHAGPALRCLRRSPAAGGCRRGIDSAGGETPGAPAPARRLRAGKQTVLKNVSAELAAREKGVMLPRLRSRRKRRSRQILRKLAGDHGIEIRGASSDK